MLEDLNKKEKLNLVFLIMIISGVAGFIYEEIFYLIDLGYLVKRGSSYGPWIPIYAFGGLFIFLLTYKYKEKPFLVFLLSTIVTGLLEYLTGMFFYEVLNTRLWDYNTEILNFGNINGYICLRSVLLFGLSGLLLIYFITPKLLKLIKSNRFKLNLTCPVLITIFFIDIFLHMILN